MSALGLGRLTEAGSPPGNRNIADFLLGVTQIKSLSGNFSVKSRIFKLEIEL